LPSHRNDNADDRTRRGEKGTQVAEHVTAGIRQGRYAPGQRLVEAELTAELGVSRGPVREAFRQLASDGVIEIVPHRGALVRRLSMREALELFEIRTALEALAAGCAARNMADGCIRERFASATAFIWNDTPRYSTSDYISENQAFHSAIYDAASNLELVRLNNQLHLSLIMSQIRSALTSEIIATSLTEHRKIAEAILAGDQKQAERASREHLKRAMEFVRSMPDALFRRAPAGPPLVVDVTAQ
jgi:DNA-binding GntR family transcriptional regulator